jgi:hypothetical protein
MPFELPPSATKNATLPDPEVPSQRNSSPIPPEPPPPPFRSSSEGDVVPYVVNTFSAQNSPPTVIPEGATSSSEGDELTVSNEVTSEKQVVKRFKGATFDDYDQISRASVWGCPVYVLVPKLQDGMKIPKWDPRSRRGMFIGGNSINLRTGNVSYHVVYDDLFTTLPNEYTGGILDGMPFNPQSWSKIVWSGLERYIDPDDEAESGTTQIPSLDREWLSDEELPPTSTRHSHYDDQPTLLIPPVNAPVHPISPIDIPASSTPPPPRSQSSEGDVAPFAVGDQEPTPTYKSEGATSSSEGDVVRGSLSDIRRGYTLFWSPKIQWIERAVQ